MQYESLKICRKTAHTEPVNFINPVNIAKLAFLSEITIITGEARQGVRSDCAVSLSKPQICQTNVRWPALICSLELLSEIQLHGQAANNAPYTLNMNVLLWLFEDIVVKCFNHSVLHFFCVWSWNNKLLGITINLLGWNCSLEMVLLKTTWKLQNNKLCIWK